MRVFLGAFVTLLGLLPLAGQAQQAGLYPPLAGQVVNGGRQPLAGVSVLVMGTTIGTSTNSEGTFLLPVSGPGTYNLRFDLPGHLLTDVVVTDTSRRPLHVVLFSTQPPARARRPKK